jgi:hypothetical protein
MSGKRVGLIEKYRVERVDGKPVAWCFVLEDKDPLALAALAAYAAMAYEAGYLRLHRDLVRKVQELSDRPESLSMDDECDRCGHPRGSHYITFNGQTLGCSEVDASNEGAEPCGCYGFFPRPEAA